LVLAALAPLTAQAATSTYQVTSTITVGSQPYGIAVNATTNTVYVTNHYGNSVSVINGATGAVTSTIAAGFSGPYGVAVDATRNTVYVANHYGNSVSVINGATGAVTSTIAAGFSGPYGVAVDATRNTVYVVNAGTPPVRVRCR
jgi:YVTN family beta-propeller protein